MCHTFMTSEILPSSRGLVSEAPPVQNQPWLQFPVGALSPSPKQYFPASHSLQAAELLWVVSGL